MIHRNVTLLHTSALGEWKDWGKDRDTCPNVHEGEKWVCVQVCTRALNISCAKSETASIGLPASVKQKR